MINPKSTSEMRSMGSSTRFEEEVGSMVPGIDVLSLDWALAIKVNLVTEESVEGLLDE
jgi:hypothetical protein